MEDYGILDSMFESLKKSLKHITRLEQPLIMDRIKSIIENGKKDFGNVVDIYDEIRRLLKTEKLLLEDSVPDRIEVKIQDLLRNDIEFSTTYFDFVMDLDDDGNVISEMEDEDDEDEMGGEGDSKQLFTFFNVINEINYAENSSIELKRASDETHISTHQTDPMGMAEISIEDINVDPNEELVFVIFGDTLMIDGDIPIPFTKNDLITASQSSINLEVYFTPKTGR